ncbi:hypothetical protein H7H78_05305 [Mycobacterium shinjukuense]|uniref:Uncharacterized protein n=1 Tax=Mycobacterium shinjukuense TaxID=398694 RepID=A0A7I7MPJ0_9MYCO|nr:hypothetical protein [Mycobacterium shinjukuense]MCV6984878.1 hypothetical protein [Mycobacterium shinjukuense]ORB70406.1 hypothetical protein BST45_06490 [Mycobacterium shinjukuense]BBX73219.1 hypothetical protein MSHI_11250 [Mycobacterium shinjukuense]
MLIIALVLALIGLVALVFAVVTSNELVAWVCIGASALGVVLLIVDAIRERQHHAAGDHAESDEPAEVEEAVDYPDEADAGEAGAADDTGSEATEESPVSADHSGDEGTR